MRYRLARCLPLGALLCLACDAASPQVLGAAPELLDVPESCAGLPLRHEAAARLSEQLASAGAGAAQAPPLLAETETLAVVYHFTDWQSGDEQAVLLSSASELQAFVEGSRLVGEVAGWDIDWQRDRVVATLEYPGQRKYRRGLLDSEFLLFAGHLDPCEAYGDLASRLFAYDHTVRFHRVGVEITATRVEIIEGPYRFNPVVVTDAGCERQGPVLGGGGHPTVLAEAGRYRMWYGGFSAATGVVFDTWSDDGESWSPAGWDEAHVAQFAGHSSLADHYSPSVLQVEGQYWMFYGDLAYDDATGEYVKTIGRSVSDDGLAWRDETVVLESGAAGSWAAGGVWAPTVSADQGQYRLWYSGSDGQGRTAIGLATSSDGTTWQPHPANPVLAPGAPGSFDDLGVSTPEVRRHGETLFLWYTGATGGGSAGNAVLEQVGLATSTDGVAWQRREGAVLQPAADFESTHVGGVAALIEGDWALLWYTAVNARAEPAIALARCPLR